MVLNWQRRLYLRCTVYVAYGHGGVGPRPSKEFASPSGGKHTLNIFLRGLVLEDSNVSLERSRTPLSTLPMTAHLLDSARVM